MTVGVNNVLRDYRVSRKHVGIEFRPFLRSLKCISERKQEFWRAEGPRVLNNLQQVQVCVTQVSEARLLTAFLQLKLDNGLTILQAHEEFAAAYAELAYGLPVRVSCPLPIMAPLAPSAIPPPLGPNNIGFPPPSGVEEDGPGAARQRYNFWSVKLHFYRL